MVGHTIQTLPQRDGGGTLPVHSVSFHKWPDVLFKHQQENGCEGSMGGTPCSLHKFLRMVEHTK